VNCGSSCASLLSQTRANCRRKLVGAKLVGIIGFESKSDRSDAQRGLSWAMRESAIAQGRLGLQAECRHSG